MNARLQAILPSLAALEPQVLESALADLDPEDAQAIVDAESRLWENWARAEQLEPGGSWRYWVCIAGRGGGKTWTGSNWINRKADLWPGARLALIGATKGDVRDVMIEDPKSGILVTSPPWNRAHFQPSLRRVTWDNGSVGIVYSADEPEQTRGLNASFAWADELGKWKAEAKGRGRDKAEAGKVMAWENLILGVRIEPAPGLPPQILVTTTPRRVGRGAELVKDLSLGPKVNGTRSFVPPRGDPATWSPRAGVIVHRWSTDRNTANLAGTFLDDLTNTYAGTTLEKQERAGEILDDVAGALWRPEWLERCHVFALPGAPTRVLVSVDPSHSESGHRDQAGIVVGCLGPDGRAYLLDDRTMSGTPLAWAQAAIAAHDHYRADAIVIETTSVNPGGGNLVKDTIRAADPQKRVKWIEIHHGTDKRTRAEPVAAMYEQDPPRVFHLLDRVHPDLWAPLEDELVSWEPSAKQSPNRLDAAVQLVTALLLGEQRAPLIAR